VVEKADKYDAQIEAVIKRYSSPQELEKRNLALYRQKSGKLLANEIEKSKPSLVLDLGCGGNPFKGLIPNLIGVDVVDHPDVDLVTEIDMLYRIFAPDSADWILNFGPLQYGDEEWEEAMVSLMHYMLHPFGTIVCHVAPKKHWTPSYIKELGEFAGLKLVGEVETSYTDTFYMSEEDEKIQRRVCEQHDIPFDRFIFPRLTWRWIK